MAWVWVKNLKNPLGQTITCMIPSVSPETMGLNNSNYVVEASPYESDVNYQRDKAIVASFFINASELNPDFRNMESFDSVGETWDFPVSGGGFHAVVNRLLSNNRLDIYLDAYNMGLRILRLNPTTYSSVGTWSGYPYYNSNTGLIIAYNEELQRLHIGVANVAIFNVGQIKDTYTLSVQKDFATNLWNLFSEYIPTPSGENPYEGGGYSDVTEETGEFDEQTEIIEEPQTPVSLAISSGFLTVYNPTYTQVVELGNYLWTTLDLNSLKKLFGNPMDCIIGVSIYPFLIPNEVDDYYIMVGNVNTLVRSKKAIGQFVNIDCGKLYIKPYSKSYLDYSPFTKIELVLPYIGSYQLDTDIIMGKWIKVTYKVDLLSGACLACLSFSDSENGEYSVISEYTGKCNVDIPLVATDFRNAQGALLGAVSSFKDYISSNGASGFSPMQSGLASTVASMKPNVNRSGALQSCIGYLGVQKPRIIKTIPRQCVAENQGYMEGFPSFIKANVSELEGFTVFEDVEIKCNVMTEKEKKRAIALLEKGVWL